nr:hypothetical protein SHINE37_70214 [Rhizobiaceae bacterium]
MEFCHRFNALGDDLLSQCLRDINDLSLAPAQDNPLNLAVWMADREDPGAPRIARPGSCGIDVI